MQKDKMKWDVNLNFFDFIYRRIPHQRRVKKKTKRELVCNSLVLNLVIWMSLLEILLFFVSLFIGLFMYAFIYLVRFVYLGKRTGNKRILESTGKEISQVLYLTWNSTKWGTRSKHTQRYMVQLFVAGGRGRVRRLGDHMVFREGVVVGNPLTGTEFEEGTGTANERRGGEGGSFKYYRALWGKSGDE